MMRYPIARRAVPATVLVNRVPEALSKLASFVHICQRWQLGSCSIGWVGWSLSALGIYVPCWWDCLENIRHWYLVCQYVVWISMIYRSLSLSVEDCLGRCASRLSEVTIVRLHFGTQMVTRKQWFLAAESELRLAKSSDLRSVPRRYVSLSACSCMFISVKLVFTVCSNHAFDGEQQKQRVRVCVCASLY